MKIISLFIACLILGLVVSWGATVGVFYLVSLCFNIGFSLKIGTGIWLIMCLISVIFIKK